jgi:hypothetical protein
MNHRVASVAIGGTMARKSKFTQVAVKIGAVTGRADRKKAH